MKRCGGTDSPRGQERPLYEMTFPALFPTRDSLRHLLRVSGRGRRRTPVRCREAQVAAGTTTADGRCLAGADRVTSIGERQASLPKRELNACGSHHSRSWAYSSDADAWSLPTKFSPCPVLLPLPFHCSLEGQRPPQHGLACPMPDLPY